MRRQVTYVLGILSLSVLGIVYTLVSGNEPLLGLDLQGGASVVLEPAEPTSEEDLDVAVEIIRNRVDGLGVAEPEITTQGGNILVQLPGVDDQQRALDLVGQTAELRFRPVLAAIDEATFQSAVAIVEEGPTDEDPPSIEADTDPADDPTPTVDPDGEDATAEGDDAEEPVPEIDPVEIAQQTIDLFTFTGDVEADEVAVLPEYDDDRNVVVRYQLGPTDVTGESLEGADAQFDTFNGWYVSPTFKSGEDGIDGFNAIGAACHARDATCPTQQIAIEIDGEVVSAPVIQRDEAIYQPFDRDRITISGNFTEREAKDLALVLDYGALPVELVAQASRVVSSTLGDDALDAGIISGLIGLTLVSIYLMAYYRLLGVVAITSLAISGALLWTIIAWLGESQGLALTLAGVTGLIVSVGVSVDSNVVYFEHLKEDVRGGRTVRSAVDRAFPIAYSTIVKADVASLIAAVVLYYLTVGQVRGFALFLGLATVLDLVATYFFMGPAIRLLAARSGLYDHPSRFGIPTTSPATEAGAA